MAKLKNGYIINPETYRTPTYRISPFNTSYNSINYRIAKEQVEENELLGNYFGASYFPCEGGRAAINMALQQYDLKPTDEVWITTTSGNKYISSCVTSEIEKFCGWSREKGANTKLIFVNHEFGFCYSSLKSLKDHGLPIIEDRALSFASNDNELLTGKTGDFVIYSLPKFFPVSFGGMLQCNNPALLQNLKPASENVTSYVTVLISHYIKETEKIKRKRRENYYYLSDKFLALGLSPRFMPSEKETPGVFMFKAHDIDLTGLKKFMQGNGVESSIFYDEPAFFIPVHQELRQEDMDFFYELISYFIQDGNQ